MARLPYFVALSPAIAAAVAGSIAQITGAVPGFILAVSVLAAATVGLLGMADFSSERDAPDEPPEPESEVTPSDSLSRAVLDVLPMGVVVVARDRSIRLANAEVAEMFGVRNVDGQPVATLRARKLLDRIELAFLRDRATTVDFTLSRRGEAFLVAHVRPTANGEVLVAIQDETRARRAGELHRDFVANASHELKTPLAAISGVIETLLGHARDDPDATERFLGLLQAQSDRMTRLVEDLLSLNRIELNERVAPDERHEVYAVVSEAAGILGPIAESSGVTLTVDLPKGETAWVLSNRDELSQIYGNLIDNAIKYGGTGTTVHVCRAAAEADTPGQIGIDVRDDGPGIAREHIPRLTERFYRVNVGHSRAKGGTGLGLAIVKHILSRHRGRLEIESTPGEGTCFRTWLPRAPEGASASPGGVENPSIVADSGASS